MLDQGGRAHHVLDRLRADVLAIDEHDGVLGAARQLHHAPHVAAGHAVGHHPPQVTGVKPAVARAEGLGCRCLVVHVARRDACGRRHAERRTGEG